MNKVQGVDTLTRTGTCPSCGKTVESTYFDIFFPYCGYSCKRIVQRAEEQAEAERIAQEDRKEEERRERENERRRLLPKKAKKKNSTAEQLISRIARCDAEYKRNKEESRVLKGRDRRNASKRALRWKQQAEAARIKLKELRAMRK